MTNATTLPKLETGVWTLDPSHTIIGFSARHLMVTKVRGGFAEFDGSLQIGETPETSSVQVSIDAASISSGSEDRDVHLRSADFLDAENHPNLTFKSTSVEADGDRLRVAGNLTIKNITRPVTLDLEFEGTATDPWGGTRASFAAKAVINREDWDLTWNMPLDSGGVLVSKDVTIEIEAQAVKQ